MNNLKNLLKDYPSEQVDKYVAYCYRIATEKNKQGQLKNLWFTKISETKLSELFRQVSSESLVLDGQHITIQSTGLSYDYIAYKNKMLVAYPESIVDVQLVYKDDIFNFKKDSGKVEYLHEIVNPFKQNEVDIIGGYCVIKNKRGEFLTLLSGEDIVKHRRVAKTDYIWASWFKEMALKTVIKKACKQHFADIYQEIELQDNENYNLDIPVSLELEWKQEIDAITTIEELGAYWKANKGRGKDFDKYVTIRKEQLQNENNKIKH